MGDAESVRLKSKLDQVIEGLKHYAASKNWGRPHAIPEAKEYIYCAGGHGYEVAQQILDKLREE